MTAILAIVELDLGLDLDWDWIGMRRGGVQAGRWRASVVQSLKYKQIY